MLRKTLKAFRHDLSGATAIEYGLIAALIAIVLIVGLETVGGGLSTLFANISSYFLAAA